MTVINIIELLGGIALFLFGMNVMGDALKKVAGNKLEVILYKLSNTTLKGILLGTGVTAVIQSSSATSVMVVGFVNSGMMKFRQALGVILGSILGTSVTGWILCLNSLGGGGSNIAQYFSTQVLTGIVAVIGIILRMFCKKTSTRSIGEILIGFAVLMFGMSTMSGAVSPLKESPEFISILTKFSNPLLGILVGAVITGILQSASAAIGILEALAVTGAITFNVGFPIILGIGIGASVPVLLTSLGASPEGKRSAFGYFFINLIGAIVVGAIFYVVNIFVDFPFMSLVLTMVLIALVNSLYRFIVVLIMIPLLTPLDKLLRKLIPDDPTALETQADMDRLESRFLAHPPLAIEQSKLVINAMADKTQTGLADAIGLRKEYDAKMLSKVFDLEATVDRYEDKLGAYLSKVSGNNLTPEQAEEVSKYLHTLSDFERISDHSKNIAESMQEMHDKKMSFSDEASHELDVLEDAVKTVVSTCFEAFRNNDPALAERVEPLEEVVDELCDELKFHHIDRLREGKCTIEGGFVFNDLLTNFERVSDHCSNIAVVVIESQDDTIQVEGEHKYLSNLKEMKDNAYSLYYQEYRDRFQI